MIRQFLMINYFFDYYQAMKIWNYKVVKCVESSINFWSQYVSDRPLASSKQFRI